MATPTTSIQRTVGPLLLVAALAGCAGDDSPVASEPAPTAPATTSAPTSAPPPSTAPPVVASTAPSPSTIEALPPIELRIETDHVAFTLVHDGSLSVAEMRDPSQDPQCGTTTALFSGERDFRVEAVPAGCEAATPIDPGNGDHGLYRTIDDVAEPIDIEQIDTALGPAVLFTQTYYECTSSCTEFAEPIAIITLDAPIDPDYPTLVVRSDKGGFDRDELRAMVETLAPPD